MAARGSLFRMTLGQCLAFVVLTGAAHAQSPQPPLPTADVIAAVDRFYPGFTEVLRYQEPASVKRLATALTENPSRESLAVLLWMLRHCSSWGTDDMNVFLQLERVATAVGRVPVAPLADVLNGAGADQRAAAAHLLANVKLFADAEAALRERTLIDAVNDPSTSVRVAVAYPLRALGTDQARAALAQALTGPDVTNGFYWQATGGARPKDPVSPPNFPPETVKMLRAIDPNYEVTLGMRDEAAMRRLLEGLRASTSAATTPVLLWALANANTGFGSLSDMAAYPLDRPPHVGRLPFAELTRLLGTNDPDRRFTVADLLARIGLSREAKLTTEDREIVIPALTAALDDPNTAVRGGAVSALGAWGARQAAGTIAASFARPDVTRFNLRDAFRVLRSIGGPEVLPVLEHWARTAGTIELREGAAAAYIAIAKPADPGREARRLLWEPPDIAWEQEVMTRGRAALPVAWNALASGSEPERRAAAAILGHYPDARSIGPILDGLAQSPGALTREQLLFDLNVILLTEGAGIEPSERNALAADHLSWMYQELARRRQDDQTRRCLGQSTIPIFPDRVVAPFSVDLSATTAVGDLGEPSRTVSTRATLAATPEAFRQSSLQGCAVVFHGMTTANGLARVAAELAGVVWISLYRNERGEWTRLDVPSIRLAQDRFNLVPTINRDYGAAYPLKVVRLDVTMERLRLLPDFAHFSLHQENLDVPDTLGPIDASYLPLLERYKRSDVPAVRYTAEFESTRLGSAPNFDLWIETLGREQPGTTYSRMAHQIVIGIALRDIEAFPTPLTSIDREQLLAAARRPDAINPLLAPTSLPATQNVRNIRRSARFGLVAVSFGTAPRGQSGYSMLFERRGDRWVFLCLTGSWMS